MAKSKKPPRPREARKLPPEGTPAPKPQSHAFRETVESIVIAFVLAFLFRTFEAEAFVIPTGSMAPTLMGRHKDVYCPKCGYRYQVSASEEESDQPHRMRSDTLAGMCPMCQYVMPMRPDLPLGVAEERLPDIPFQKSYNGDRILVNKYIYTFTDPQRWDVVVFKFPGNSQINYIKRLVALPGETLQVYQGDLFVRAAEDGDFQIVRKPPEKILAMRQLVHDTDYDPAELDDVGWPLRWHPQPLGTEKGWQVKKETDGKNVRQRYLLDRQEQVAWLQYEHIVPTYRVWQLVTAVASEPSADAGALAEIRNQQRLRLITDANPYNAREHRLRMAFPDRLEIDPQKLGVHWVGDLMLEADVEVREAAGSLVLVLVEGGRHFSCTIDLTSGEASLSIAGVAEFSPKAQTTVRGPGTYRLSFANFDDQLLLWVDGDLISFDGETAYEGQRVFGQRGSILPQTSSEDLGDLAPARIGGRDASLVVNHLRLWRDIYYIADDWRRNPGGDYVTDFDHPFDRRLLDLPWEPSLWPRYRERRRAEFQLGNDQFFVMGDNSAESSDARLWANFDPHTGGQPGGAYLERRLLIGKALCVYWPHSWNRIPGTPIPFPLFPNFADMRLVR